jgi:hypothetical protein
VTGIDAKPGGRVPSYVAQGRFFMWVVVLAGIGAWMVHLVAETALVRLSCNDSSYRVLMHAFTIATAAVTAGAMALCIGYVRRAGTDGDEVDTVDGRTRFLGVFGALINGISLALILLEGFSIFVFRSCA